MHLIRKELINKYIKFMSTDYWAKRIEDEWKNIAKGLEMRDLDRIFKAVKALLFIRKRLTIHVD